MLISTISVYSWGHRYTHKARVYENDSIDENLESIRHDLGYVQSKWVMKKLADLAASAGLPVGLQSCEVFFNARYGSRIRAHR